MEEEVSPESVPQMSVIVPALNEENTLQEVIDRLLALPLRTQVIVVDDGSRDQTPTILAAFGDRIELLTNPSPGGKGAAIRQALSRARGEVVVIQDADLEYRPEEIPDLVRPILEGQADVVYGTRFSRGMPAGMALPNKIVNRLLVWAVRVLYFRKITDEATCYKAFRRSVIERMNLVCHRFEFCPEVTAKAIRMGKKIVEIPITYEPRNKDAGKKIRWTDAPEAFWTLLRHRWGKF
ncbi:MAG TPA: glycosyltransferase family 2 protein [Fimbriimonadaceae bacterium]|nr:glycosyltransferase family 2 protein [Fimbriimonadaceae bacterium]HRJ32134.1 glycosyltransferase family 2 protein [Fimbriimonadaceae bacterium]